MIALKIFIISIALCALAYLLDTNLPVDYSLNTTRIAVQIIEVVTAFVAVGSLLWMLVGLVIK